VVPYCTAVMYFVSSSSSSSSYYYFFVVVAFCPNSNEVHIYKLLQDKWEKVHVLQKVLCSKSFTQQKRPIYIIYVAKSSQLLCFTTTA
jgi:hypothetical protein